ncbi:cytochrome c oxidase assembly protein [Telmatospirillum sp. J64-1]|uniref:cytochrome c oxidase assembly protein n=1 Tax=Telmatospirillum sp. J64-1 TaxID=2502183 RepID=UPI00115EC68A|nr:cytochrome c oxidase assembly protein [Telmatospirillum sp. J64-1]
MSELDLLLSLCLASLPAVEPGRLWTAWSFSPWVVLPLAALAGLYGLGVLRGARPGRGERWFFALGWAALALALLSPLCRLSPHLAWAHMVQHGLLAAVAPLLLVLARPGPVLWRGLGRRRETGEAARGIWGVALLYGAAIWLWHLPGPYQATLFSESIHLLYYVTLLGASLLFWRTIIADGRSGGVAGMRAVVTLLGTVVHTGLLGALLTFSPRLWYPAQAALVPDWAVSAATDQQLAGLIMWIPLGAIYAVAGVMILGRQLGGEVSSRP